MKSTFTRALAVFLVLTTALAGFTMVALWGIETFAGGKWWASLAILVVALVAEISLFYDTLSEPLKRWIKAAEDEDRFYFSEAQMRRVAEDVYAKKQQAND